MPTLVGILFFCVGAYFFARKEDGLLGLLIVASVFQASSAINIAGRGIQPYYLIAAFIIARALANRLLGRPSQHVMPQRKWLLLFGWIAVISAFTLPIIFAGIPVYDPKVGIDDGLFIRPPLTIGVNNAAQAGFLAWSLVTAFSLLGIRTSASKTRKGFLCAFYLGVFFIFAQAASQLAGIPYPDNLLRNNPGYEISDPTLETAGIRSPGTFAEPSFAGVFLAFYCLGFTAEYLAGKGSAPRVIIALVASGEVASSGSLLTLALCLAALLLGNSPYRPPWYVNVPRGKRLVFVVLILVAPFVVALVSFSSYRDALLTLTVSKGDSGSFFNRTASDLYALQLLIKTHGVGVGLGSNRASSMLTSLLSDIGVFGVFSFGMFYFKLFGNLSKENGWLKWGAFALLLNMCIDSPDVTFPILWIAIFLGIHVTLNRRGDLLQRVGATWQRLIVM